MNDLSKPTIYDIATKAAASPSTVSAVLNGSWKKRRIGAETADRIRQVARELGYSANIQARALRTTKSGIVGMILPQHDNSFFASLSQAFTEASRERGAMPAIISTRRDRDQEVDSLWNLIGYSVDALMIVGAKAHDELHEICRDANVPHVFVDQPCNAAPSVVSDNAAGVEELTLAILDRAGAEIGEEIYFLGGDSHLYASRKRIEGFQAALRQAGLPAIEDRVLACGYSRTASFYSLQDLYGRLGRLPKGLIINSMGCFEGTLEFLSELPEQEIAMCHFGVWDYDPIAALCRISMPMIRQKAEVMIRKAFVHLDARDTAPSLTKIKPELILPRTL
ncbi:LacI family DNA-binding transcriptional regulator [Gymnodinialimonas sp. 2305UL16-5]|uniref:LacI family DNA-binding transcriptional regulator n=1 Tax=Gymnodinialimonas mytili TaxID=3126503 RepID=UPI003099BEF2